MVPGSRNVVPYHPVNRFSGEKPRMQADCRDLDSAASEKYLGPHVLLSDLVVFCRVSEPAERIRKHLQRLVQKYAVHAGHVPGRRLLGLKQPPLLKEILAHHVFAMMSSVLGGVLCITGIDVHVSRTRQTCGIRRWERHSCIDGGCRTTVLRDGDT